MSEDFGKTVLLQSEVQGKSYLLEIETGKKFFLEKEHTIIGSQRGRVDICLSVPTISRVHAKIICRNKMCIRDRSRRYFEFYRCIDTGKENGRKYERNFKPLYFVY